MLALNEPAAGRQPQIYKCQAFKTAAESFEPIDSKTRGVIVPYMKKGKKIIADLCKAVSFVPSGRT